MVELLIFDLDGTLIDSRRDLAGAVNYMRQSMGLEPLGCERIVSFIGNGLNSLIRRSIADAEVDFDTAVNRMKRFYADHLVESTTLYSGVADTLKQLKDKNIKLAVVTNKHGQEAKRILEALGVAGYFNDIIGGDGQFPLKPEPDALLALQKKYQAKTEGCWMIGDHYTDLEAGRRAGFRRIMANYGFGEAREEKPDYSIEHFPEIIDLLRGF